MLKTLVASFIALSLLSGCQDSSTAFVGTWHRAKYPKETITIKDEGNGKISLTGNPTPSGTEIGHVEGDTAVFNAMLTATFKADGTLIFAGDEYRK